MTTHYSAHVELDRRRITPDIADAMLSHLDGHHAAVAVSPRGWLDAQITLPAETLPQAASLACAVVVAAARAAGVHADPVAVEVMTEAEFNIREDFDDEEETGPAPALIGTADVAERLGVSLARVGQLAREGKLDATRLGARSWGYDPQQVEALRRSRVAS